MRAIGFDQKGKYLNNAGSKRRRDRKGGREFI